MHPCRSRSVQSTDRRLLAPLITVWLSMPPNFRKFSIPNFVKIWQTFWHFTGRQKQGIGLQMRRSSLILKERVVEFVLPFWTKTVLKHACGTHLRCKTWVIRICRISCTVRDCGLPPQSREEPRSTGLISSVQWLIPYPRFGTTYQSHL